MSGDPAGRFPVGLRAGNQADEGIAVSSASGAPASKPANTPAEARNRVAGDIFHAKFHVLCHGVPV